jgi:hypothetical protein
MERRIEKRHPQRLTDFYVWHTLLRYLYKGELQAEEEPLHHESASCAIDQPDIYYLSLPNMIFWGASNSAKVPPHVLSLTR